MSFPTGTPSAARCGGVFSRPRRRNHYRRRGRRSALQNGEERCGDGRDFEHPHDCVTRDIAEKVWPLPVRKLLGVGPETEARLATLGVTTIGGLATIPPAMLQQNFGEAHGRYLHEAAQGIDETPLITEWEPHSFGRQITFQKDIIDKRAIAKELKTLVESVLEDARKEGYRAKAVTARIRFAVRH